VSGYYNDPEGGCGLMAAVAIGFLVVFAVLLVLYLR
jgi:hypothetical protein